MNMGPIIHKGEGPIVLHDYFPEMRSLWPGQQPLIGNFLALNRFLSGRCRLCRCPIRRVAIAH